MPGPLSKKKIAIVVADGFEQSEMTSPRDALEEAGAQTTLISPHNGLVKGHVKGWQHTGWGDEFEVDMLISEAHADAFDALVLPGGVMNPDTLRVDPKAIELITEFARMGKPIAAICHGPWTLINAKLVRGKRMTSYPSIRQDLENAGAHWVDEEVVVDRGLITSRSPKDLPAFNRAIQEELAGEHSILQVEYRD